jgi:methylenetetrahydrofolate reductase (NADPH)
MNAAVVEFGRSELKRRVLKFAQGMSTEISPHDEALIPALANKLPAGTTVYVAHTPKAALEDVVRIAIKLESLGLRASPHIVARRLLSERALRAALRELKDGGVEKILLVAGDRDPPIGKFASAMEVLETGATVEVGMMAVGVGGHPEGHKAIGPSTLWSALRHKQAFAERTGTKMHVVTQFGFSPDAVCAWDSHLAEHGISLPVHVGIAGPTPLPKLIRFAMHCGVGASLGALIKNMSAVSHVARPATSPDEMLVGVVRGCVGGAPNYTAGRPTHLVKPHVYSFGGAMATARWVRAVVDGSFELHPDSGRFVLTG